MPNIDFTVRCRDCGKVLDTGSSLDDEDGLTLRVPACPYCLGKEFQKGAGTTKGIAEKIAEALFTNGSGEAAERLILDKNGKNLGGWSWIAVAQEIERVLKEKA